MSNPMIKPYKTPKRKNDAARLYRRMIIGMMLIAVVIVTLVGIVSLRRPPSQPTGTLYFRGRDVGDPPTSALDPQTLTSEFVAWDPPVEDLALSVLSPDGRWEIEWNPQPDFGGYGILATNLLNQGGGFWLTGQPSSDYLSWSADSQWIGYTAYDPAYGDGPRAWGWIMSTDKGQTRAVVTDMDVQRLVFAPTGARLAYVAEGNLWTLDITTGLKTQVASLYGQDQTIIWSPDGEWLAYRKPPIGTGGHSEGNVPFNIWIVRVDGSDARMLVANGLPNTILGWEDGSRHRTFEEIQTQIQTQK